MPLYRLEEPSPALTAPVVVAAFDGWIDAAGAASSAADQLADGAGLLATFEDDVLFDYRSRRPTLDVVDGTLTRLVWPTLELHRREASGRDLLVLHGAEPDFRWKELANDILELCLRLGVVEWISLGAIPAAVPHTRPVPVMATASAEGTLHEAETKGPAGTAACPERRAFRDGGRGERQRYPRRRVLRPGSPLRGRSVRGRDARAAPASLPAPADRAPARFVERGRHDPT